MPRSKKPRWPKNKEDPHKTNFEATNHLKNTMNGVDVAHRDYTAKIVMLNNPNIITKDVLQNGKIDFKILMNVIDKQLNKELLE